MTELTCIFKNYMILFDQKCQVPHNKLLSITLRACYHLHQMTAVMKGNRKSVTRVEEEHLHGSRNARCWIVVPRKVQQIHQAKNPYAAAWFTWCIFTNTFCWLSQWPHVWYWNLKVSWKACIQARDGKNHFRFQSGFWSDQKPPKNHRKTTEKPPKTTEKPLWKTTPY